MDNKDFDKQQRVEVKNEGSATVFLHNPNSQSPAKKINPKGRIFLTPLELQEYVYAGDGNDKIVSQHLTIVNPEVREFIEIAEEPVVTNDIIKSKLTVMSADGIKDLEAFLKGSSPPILERVARMTVDLNVTDARIVMLVEKYTNYRDLMTQITEKIEEENADDDE